MACQPDSCSGHGACSYGPHCTCDAGWTSPNCSQPGARAHAMQLLRCHTLSGVLTHTGCPLACMQTPVPPTRAALTARARTMAAAYALLAGGVPTAPWQMPAAARRHAQARESCATGAAHAVATRAGSASCAPLQMSASATTAAATASAHGASAPVTQAILGLRARSETPALPTTAADTGTVCLAPAASANATTVRQRPWSGLHAN